VGEMLEMTVSMTVLCGNVIAALGRDTV
jgi:hypothetical protein